MTKSTRPSLTSEEANDAAIERVAGNHNDMTCASMEPHSKEMVMWNSGGEAVVVPQRDQDAIISLMVRGRLHVDHFVALVDAMEKDNSQFGMLMDLFKSLVGFLPPAEYDRAMSRLAAMWTTEHPETQVLRYGAMVAASISGGGEAISLVA